MTLGQAEHRTMGFGSSSACTQIQHVDFTHARLWAGFGLARPYAMGRLRLRRLSGSKCSNEDQLRQPRHQLGQRAALPHRVPT